MGEGFAVAVVSQPIGLVSSIAVGDVSSFFELEVPGGDDDEVIDAYPRASLHFAADAAESGESIEAADHDAVVAE